jgi:hypothetical protein
MSRILKKQISISDKVIVWSAAAVGLIAAITLDKGSAPHKWHAAIMWTGVAFYGVLIFGRRKWKSWRFWIFWAACLGLHVFAMWLIFVQLLPRLILGTLYVVPIAFIEATFLVGMFAKLEPKLNPEHHRRQHSEMGPTQGE